MPMAMTKSTTASTQNGRRGFALDFFRRCAPLRPGTRATGSAGVTAPGGRAASTCSSTTAACGPDAASARGRGALGLAGLPLLADLCLLTAQVAQVVQLRATD